MSTIEAVATRRSIRSFLPDPVPPAIVSAILDAASRAPSGTNQQPWKAHVVSGPIRDELCRRVLAKRDAEPHRERSKGKFGEHQFYPDVLPPQILQRQRKVGFDLYGLLGIGKLDRAASWRFAGRNFEFFGAPVGMIFTMERELQLGSWLDYGFFLNSLALAARGFNLHTCLQLSWSHYHDVIRDCLDIPQSEIVVCGMSLGYADPNSPANALRTEREALTNIVVFPEVRP